MKTNQNFGEIKIQKQQSKKKPKKKTAYSWQMLVDRSTFSMLKTKRLQTTFCVLMSFFCMLPSSVPKIISVLRLNMSKCVNRIETQ